MGIRRLIAAALSDLELLHIEMDLLWKTASGPELVIASAREGLRVRLTPDAPERIASAARAEEKLALASFLRVLNGTVRDGL